MVGTAIGGYILAAVFYFLFVWYQRLDIRFHNLACHELVGCTDKLRELAQQHPECAAQLISYAETIAKLTLENEPHPIDVPRMRELGKREWK